MKSQTERLSKEKIRGKGPKEIFGINAQNHDKSVNSLSKLVFSNLQKKHPNLEFRFRDKIDKKEINEKLNLIDPRLGVTIFIPKSSIKPDGGIIEVKDENSKWRIILVSEAKHQGKDIDNIRNGVLVGKNKNQELMVAGNAIERSHKNINEMRNIMLDEKHFPYILFLEGSNFLTKPFVVTRPDGSERVLKPDDGSLNRIDRLTSCNYGLPINSNHCENIFININNQSVMLQSVSIFTNPTEWSTEEMTSIMEDVAHTSLKIIGLV